MQTVMLLQFQYLVCYSVSKTNNDWFIAEFKLKCLVEYKAYVRVALDENISNVEYEQ